LGKTVRGGAAEAGSFGAVGVCLRAVSSIFEEHGGATMKRFTWGCLRSVTAMASVLWLSGPAWALHSYGVNDGPSWDTDPPTYTCIEACRLILLDE
jgi:hypothetical protein